MISHWILGSPILRRPCLSNLSSLEEAWQLILSSGPTLSGVLARKGEFSQHIRTYFPSWFSGCIAAAGAQGRDFDFIDWRSAAEILSLPQFLKAQ
jgi:hypothetical protein